MQKTKLKRSSGMYTFSAMLNIVWIGICHSHVTETFCISAHFGHFLTKNIRNICSLHANGSMPIALMLYTHITIDEIKFLISLHSITPCVLVSTRKIHFIVISMEFVFSMFNVRVHDIYSEMQLHNMYWQIGWSTSQHCTHFCNICRWYQTK